MNTQTHFKRLRTDFDEDRAKCLSRRYRAHEPSRSRGSKPCQLPNECELCCHWICNACEKTVPWSNGNGATTEEGGGLLCDDCWVKYLLQWEAAEEKLEATKMHKLSRAYAL